MENGVTPTPQDQIPTPQAKKNMDKLDTILKEIRDSRQAIENRLGKEGSDPTRYIETWLQYIAKGRLLVHFVVERAHVSLAENPFQELQKDL
ncbi:hypothetical protein NDU88_004474 [Pleurodeles waltl]|uniref:Uncharacterized protein n=1 Tax=Pleurodeles waltl TaxID=8319 RepID=A0AAV7RFT8_PLEWA|nr:hypothetical protein NDU88_004474 [Pleurodeles waltl]